MNVVISEIPEMNVDQDMRAWIPRPLKCLTPDPEELTPFSSFWTIAVPCISP